MIRKKSQKKASRHPIKKDNRNNAVSSLWTGRHFWEKKLFENADSDSNDYLKNSIGSRITEENTDVNYIVSDVDISEASDAFETYKMSRIKNNQETRENNENTEDEANSQTQHDTDSTIVQDPDPYVYHSLFQYKYKK